MNIQEALITIDEMISNIERGHDLEFNSSSCTDRSFYETMREVQGAEIQKYTALRDEIERGLEY